MVTLTDYLMVEWLLQPEAYPHEVASVEMVETHISYLFLTGQYAYKVKKPVDLGFLDFTSLEKRRFYCHQEVALNRRISPDVYLGVAEIRRDGCSYSVDGPGHIVDYAVKMRQLPRRYAMSALLERGELASEDIRQLAAFIAEFHRRAATGPEISRLGGFEAVRENVEENFAQTERFIGEVISQDAFDDLAAYSRAFLAVNEDVFRSRGEQGHVRDCHGDLHTAQVFLEPSIGPGAPSTVSIIDCIEFNERFRYSDVAEDIAFLAMDLDFHGRSDLSRLFIDTYIEASGDTGVRSLLDFFKAYRAYVRGKVHAFRLDDSKTPGSARESMLATARDYFRLAHSYAEVLPKPTIIMLAGLSGTGKSTVAQEMARRWDLEVISSDVTRKGLAGIGPTDHRYSPFGAGIYTPEFTRSTYKAMFRQAESLLRQGRSVVLDATFRHAEERSRGLALAESCGAEVWVVELTLDEATTKARMQRRALAGDSASDALWEQYQHQKKDWEPVLEAPLGRHVRIDTGGSLQEVMKQLLLQLYASVLRLRS